MGNIAFSVEKFVDLNKVINLDIDKNVNVTVDNDDILATAEADAEAFGPNALAEVDAFTYVNSTDGGTGSSATGALDILGNSTEFVFGPDSDGDGAYDTITVLFDGNANVDDVNGFGSLASLTTPPDGTAAGPSTPDGPLPDPLLSITDLNLAQTGNIIITPAGDVEAEYELTSDWVVNLGPREVDLNGDGVNGSGDLILTVPVGTQFLAEYVGPGEIPPIDPPAGPIEIEFEAFAGGNAAVITYNDPCEDGSLNFEVPTFIFEAETLQDPAVGISDWAFEFTVFGECPPPGGDGEAFAYAESTAALDLA